MLNYTRITRFAFAMIDPINISLSCPNNLNNFYLAEEKLSEIKSYELISRTKLAKSDRKSESDEETPQCLEALDLIILVNGDGYSACSPLVVRIYRYALYFGGWKRKKRAEEKGCGTRFSATNNKRIEFGTSSFERSSTFRHFPAANGNSRVHAACTYVCIRCGNSRCAIKVIRGALNSARKRPGTDMVFFEKEGSTRFVANE